MNLKTNLEFTDSDDIEMFIYWNGGYSSYMVWKEEDHNESISYAKNVFEAGGVDSIIIYGTKTVPTIEII